MDLTKGLLKGFIDAGYKVGGFDAYITSNVISAAGVSSSASYEMLLCAMLNTFFNEGKMDTVAYAHVGKYAENHYWDKASGLLDQMACAVGGLITIDFKDPAAPAVEKIDFDFAQAGHSLIIVQTGKGHADLSADYSSIPEEMKKVAAYFGKSVLAEVSEGALLENLAAVREQAGDRSVMRALHFFEENKKVDKEVAALKEGRFEDFLSLITASGNSSWKWLQNCYTNSSYQEQGISVEEKRPFHHALDDAYYTGQVMSRMGFEQVKAFLSVDYYQLPKTEGEEIYLSFPGYTKYVSRQFWSKEGVMADKRVNDVYCPCCRRALRKKIRWFAVNPKLYECLAICPEHGLVRGKIRIKKAEDGGVFAVRITKAVDEAGAQLVAEKRAALKQRKAEKCDTAGNDTRKAHARGKGVRKSQNER